MRMNIRSIALILIFISNSSFAAKFYPVPDDVPVLKVGPGILIALQDIKPSDHVLILRNGEQANYQGSRYEANQFYHWSLNGGGYCVLNSNVDFPKGTAMNFIHEPGRDVKSYFSDNNFYWVTEYWFQPGANGSKFPMLRCYLQEGHTVATVGQFRKHFRKFFEIKSVHNYTKNEQD